MSRRKLLVIVVLISLLALISIPFVIQANPDTTLTSCAPDFIDIDNGAVPVTIPIVFTGIDMSTVTNVTFSYSAGGAPSGGVSAVITSGPTATSFTADVTAQAGTTRGPWNVNLWNGGTLLHTMYAGLFVCSLPYPGAGLGSGVSLQIAAFWDALGTIPVSTPVQQGDHIYFRVRLQVDAGSYAYMGGQLAIQFPDKGAYHKVAGYGTLTGNHTTIPEINTANTFYAMCPEFYEVDAAHLMEYPAGSGVIVLVTGASYGSHTDAVRPYLNINQLPGRQEEPYTLTTCTAFNEITLLMYGDLKVYKELNLNGAGPSGISQNFTLNVYGPSHPYPGITHVVHVVDGQINPSSDSPWHLTELIPGDYTVSEVTPGGSWTKSGGGGVQVKSAFTANSTVTNTFTPGSLEITKKVDFGGAIGASTTLNATFTATVTGPSYPSGTTHDFVITDGVLSNSPWMLDNLIPGDYAIEEGAVTGWSEVVTSSPTVVVSGSTATANITNTYIPGSLEITKKVDFGEAVGASTTLNATFTATVTGPSYPSGTTHDFVITDGVLSNSPWTLPNLIAGAYTISEGAVTG
jgi:hypothetical protein